MTSVAGESSISDKKDFNCQMGKNQNSLKIKKGTKSFMPRSDDFWLIRILNSNPIENFLGYTPARWKQ